MTSTTRILRVAASGQSTVLEFLRDEGAQSYMSLWDDIRTASVDHMQLSFQQRRQQIVGDCHQLETDVDSFNDNSNPDRPIQTMFDFRADLAELKAAILWDPRWFAIVSRQPSSSSLT